jgi:16S rRNA (guanine(966)-N(2))-methyltransferase RsmD
VRIIAGKYKSRKIYTPPAKERAVKLYGAKGLIGFRPTTDRARETLFNTLNNIIDFDDISCLDLFAGTGSLGFETLSRGAHHAEFVESSARQIALIKKTGQDLGCEDSITTFKEDSLLFLRRNIGAEYDLVFADPPYHFESYNELVADVLKLKFSIFVLEHGSHNESYMYDIKEFDMISKKAGAVNFKIFVSKN